MLVVLLAGICGISAIPENEFQYNEINSNNDGCDICDGCYADKARCEYYALTKDILRNKIIKNDTQEEINDEIDCMTFEYMERVVNETKYKDCLPLVSQYTNCNQDNICIGCKTCSCGVDGRWNCTVVHRCQPDDVIPMDHHTLVLVMEKLKDYKNAILNKRIKRSITSEKKEVMKPEEVLNWMYDLKGFNVNYNNSRPSTENSILNISITLTDKNATEDNETNTGILPNSEPLVFQDLLNNLNLKNDENHMSLEEITHSENIIVPQFGSSDIFDDMKNSIFTDTTILNDNNDRNRNQRDRMMDDVFAYIDADANQNYNYRRDTQRDTRYIGKRDVDNVNVTDTTISTAHTTENKNTTIEVHDVLNPLNEIVNQKQNELLKLIEIKDKFITHINTIHNVNIAHNNTKTKNNNFKLYLVDMGFVGNNSEDLRKRDPNILNKYIQKLKRDIREVVSDVAGIQKYSNRSSIPHDLKILIRAMKNYVTKDIESKKKYSNNTLNVVNLRKTFNINIRRENHFCPIDEIIKLFEALDSDMPASNALDHLTPTTRKIVSRLIYLFYMNNNRFTIPPINITAELNKTGDGWDKMTVDIATVPTIERLYNMKLFHLVLSTDIKKLGDALKLLQFARNRRMTAIDEVAGENLIGKISNNLRRSAHRFNHVLQFQTRGPSMTSSTQKIIKKKKSFFQKIKSLLRYSKREIKRLLRRKVPKNEIVKHLARKKMDEIRNNKINQYEETMRRWQNNLNIASRYKREARDIQNVINSINNIIPGLRTHKRSNWKNGNQTHKTKDSRTSGSKNNDVTSSTKKTTSLKHKHRNYKKTTSNIL